MPGRARLEITVHIGQITRVSAIFVFLNKVKGNSLYCLISPDLFICIWYCTKTISSDKASIDISDTFKLLYLFKKMWKYPSDCF